MSWPCSNLYMNFKRMKSLFWNCWELIERSPVHMIFPNLWCNLLLLFCAVENKHQNFLIWWLTCNHAISKIKSDNCHCLLQATQMRYKLGLVSQLPFLSHFVQKMLFRMEIHSIPHCFTHNDAISIKAYISAYPYIVFVYLSSFSALKKGFQILCGGYAEKK